MNYQYLISPIPLMKRARTSERALALQAGISRTCLRQIISRSVNSTIQSLLKLASSLDVELTLLLHTQQILSEYSTVAISYKIMKDGFESWKIHLFDLVDEFRRTLDPRLILLPPPSNLDLKLESLLAATVEQLCYEAKMPAPLWAKNGHFLPTPWFVSEIESLKASALLESPHPFRKNNIFVHDNFLMRV